MLAPVNRATERRLLILCLRARWQPDALDRARELVAESGVNWAEVRRIAVAEGVAPLLYDAMRGQRLAPAADEEALKQDSATSCRYGMQMMAQLDAILRRFNRAGIPVILLKGAALVETVYRQAALRPMSDLDLLLRDEDVYRAVDALGALRFAAARIEERRGAALQFENEIRLTRTRPPNCVVELHWSLFDSPHHQALIGMDWFWSTARPCRVGQSSAQVLCPEALLLHLCGHLWLHHRDGARMLWLHDIVEVITRYGGEIDWDVVQERARKYDLVLPLRETVLTCVKEWGAAIPEDAISSIGRLQPSATERHALARTTTAQLSVAGRFWSDLAGLSGWRTRAGYALGNLFPSVAYMRWRYKIRAPLLVPFLYPYRWLLGLRSTRLPRR
jgi:hypothetical protein